MSEYVITCCSTADMSKEFLEKNHVPFAMFHYQMNGAEYPDDLYTSITPKEFYKKISDGAEPVTSQVNAEQYCQMFEPILKEGKDVLHLTLSSGISGTVNSANVAKAQMEDAYPDRRVVVIDTLAASSGYGLVLTAALENQQKGMSLEENVKWLEEHKNTAHHWFFSSDLTSFIRGGRISKVSGFFGQALNICPVMNVNSEGKLIPRVKCRGKKAAMKETLKIMKEHIQNGADYNGHCYISNSDCYDDARTLADMIEETFANLKGKVEIYNIGTVIGSHTGPGTVALFFWGDERIL